MDWYDQHFALDSFQWTGGYVIDDYITYVTEVYIELKRRPEGISINNRDQWIMLCNLSIIEVSFE